jgi:hypothetical protein
MTDCGRIQRMLARAAPCCAITTCTARPIVPRVRVCVGVCVCVGVGGNVCVRARVCVRASLCACEWAAMHAATDATSALEPDSSRTRQPARAG